MKHYQVIIIGGGNAGISVAAQLLRKRKDLKIAIVEPSDKHFYQPAWTLVGGGAFNIRKTMRSESSVMPDKVTWVKESVSGFQPSSNSIQTREGNTYTYDYLVVAPGIQLNWEKVKGLKETLGKNGVTSNYAFEYAPYTYECIKNIKPGQTAIFTSPSTPVKCGGAPQKIMYLASDLFRRKNILKDVNVEFVSGGTVLFGIKRYADELYKLVKKYGIKLNFRYDLVAIDGEKKEATFKVSDGGSETFVTKHFDVIHVTPPQSAPDFISSSELADSKGWLDVDMFTLRHVRYNNIYGLGDVTNTPNSKTGAAVRKQAPVLVKNLISTIDGKEPSAQYNGYGSCPIVAGYGKLILAEFGYENKIMETFPFDQSKPRWTMWVLKKYILPWLYWHKILKGTA